MTLKVIHQLQAFSNEIRLTLVQHFTWFQTSVFARFLCSSRASCVLMGVRTRDKYTNTMLAYICLEWWLTCNCVLQQAKAVVLRPTSSITLHSPHSRSRSSSPAPIDNRTPLSDDDSNLQTPTRPRSPAVDSRSPVDEADDRALFESPSGPDDDRRQRRVAEADQSSRGDLYHGVVRRKRSDESEIDNVDALDIDEERLARVRTS